MKTIQINPSIFRTYDIRGIYPNDLNEKNIEIVIKAIYFYLTKIIKKPVLKIVLGRDVRVSSPLLYQKAKEVLIKIGAFILEAGMISTPTMYFSVLKYESDIGIQITASHNPPQYNGLKIVRREGRKIIKIGRGAGMEEIKDLALKNKFPSFQKKGKIEKINQATAEDVEEAFRSVNPKNIKNFKIVADPANGMAISYLEEIFKRLPCQLIKMNFVYDGNFPAHQPNPLDFTTLKDLQKKVVEEKADLGIAPDGDGDRVFFIDEKGKVIPATLITSLLSDWILKKNPQASIIVDIRYTGNVINVCKKHKAKYYLSPVGHALITPLLNEKKAIFAGESSGHFYFLETGGAESSIRVILTILEIMGKMKKPISQIVKTYLSSYESGEYNFILPEEIKAKDLFCQVEKKYLRGKVSYLDGLAIDFPDWRFSLRASNTEPLVRLNVESSEKKLTEEKLKELIEFIQKLGGRLES